MSGQRPRRPAMRTSLQLDQHVGGEAPAETLEVAHATAQVIVHRGRAADDPEVTRRLVELVDELGLDALSQLWSQRPPRSLPGALWRLHALRQWVIAQPEEVARWYRAGSAWAEVSHAVAGVVDPPGPQEVRVLADHVLRGVYAGDLAVALERAAAFCRVVAAGRGVEPEADDLPAGEGARRGMALLGTAEDLDAAARLWRRDRLE
ncbi:hypothetical protein [Kytococcus aerolatus]|nr:hypothetical protein [Kytococcus aerolatus]